LTAWHTTAEPFPLDHPCLPGHFPGHPLIPGVLILERVIDCLLQRHPGLETREIGSAKFLLPLSAGQAFTIHYREREREIEFECRLDDAILSSGRVKLATPEKPV
jgi:3-hydroxyacyl-[acyl-carrier-protein] dehydratase